MSEVNFDSNQKELETMEGEFPSRQLLKLDTLEKRYSKWREAFSIWKQKGRLLYLDKKRQQRRHWNPVLEESHSFIRWMKCTKESYIACVKNSAIICGCGYFFFVYDTNSTKHQLYSATDINGINCLQGCKDEDVFAFAEKGNTPRIFVVNYPDLQKTFILRDRYLGKVTNLQFGKDGLLIALKCNYAEHRVVLWYWRYSYMIGSYILDRPHKHPDFMSTSLSNTSCAVLQEHHDKMMLQLWDFYLVCDHSLLAKKESFDVTLEKYIYHDMQYDSNGDLHLMDEKGNLYVFDSEAKKVNLLIPWKPDYPPVNDIIENEMLIDIFLPQKRRQKINDDREVKYVKEKYKELEAGPPSTIKIKKYNKYKYEEVDFDKYEDESDTYAEDGKEKSTYARSDFKHPCYFVWFKDGVVLSGPDAKLKYYVKDRESGKWVKMWGFFPYTPLKYMVTNQKQDRLYGWSERFGLKEIRPTETSSTSLYFFGGSIKRVALLHPKDHFVLTLTSMQTLCIWRKKSGRLMNIHKIKSQMQDMTVHESCELVVMHPENEGSLYGIVMVDPRDPKVWPVLKVCREPFSSVKFLSDDWLITMSQFCVKITLIKANLFDGFEIISTYEFYYEVINFIGVKARDGIYRGVALFDKVTPGSQLTPEGYKAGKVFEIIQFPRLTHEKIFNSENFYSNIYSGPCLGHIIAVPGDMKFEVHSYLINEDDGNNLRLIARIKTGHQVGTFQVLITEQHYITYGFDGHIFVHDSADFYHQEERPVAKLNNHHHSDGGVNQAVVDYKGKYVLSLGEDGNFICSRIKKQYSCKHPSHKPKRMKQPLRNPLIAPELKHVRDCGEEFWEDVVARKKNEMDQVVAEHRVARIKKEFENIKELWNEYYEQNQREKENERLGEQFFEIDTERIPIMKELLAKNLKKETEELTNKTRVCLHWIKVWRDLLWEKMDIKLYRLKPFTARFYIENCHQCVKPHRYVCYQNIMDALSQMDIAIFPVSDPKMLPWNELDQDNEFPEYKLQKDPFTEDEEETEYFKQETEIEDKKIEEEEQEKAEEEETVEEEVEDLEVVHKLDKYIESSEVETKNLDEPLFKLEDMKEIAAWKEAELKKIKEGTLTPEQREAFIVEMLEELFEFHKKKCEEIEADQVKFRELGEEGVQEEIEDVEEEIEGESKEFLEEEVDLEHLKGDTLLDTQKQENPEIEAEDAGSESSTTFTWSEIGIESLPPADVEEVTPEPEVEQEDEDVPPPSRPLPPPYVEPEEVDEAEPEPVDPLIEPYCMTGAQTSKFIPIDFVRFNEFTCNGMLTADVQVATLKRVIEALEEESNKLFNEKMSKKGDNLLLIDQKRSEILKNIDDLTNVCKVEAPDPPAEYLWSWGEIPEWIFEYEPSPDEIIKKNRKTASNKREEDALREKIKKVLNESDQLDENEKQYVSEYEERKDGVEAYLEKNDGKETIDENLSDEESLFRYDALYKMMDGVLEMTWQESVLKGVKMPAFIKEKDPGSYTEREQMALYNYMQEMKKIDDIRLQNADLAKKDISRLKQEIQDITENYDSVLSQTLRKKMLLESCKQSELLKIARMKHKRLLANKGFRHIDYLKKMQNDLLDKTAQISIILKFLQRKNVFLTKEAEKYELLPNKIEKDFLKKIAPLALPKKTIEHLKSLLKVKPANTSEFEKNSSYNEYHAMAIYLNQDYRPLYLSGASVKYFKVLDDLDSLKNCPHSVELPVWEWLIHSRHATLSAEMKMKIYKIFIPEMEKLTYEYFKYFLKYLERIKEMKEFADLEEESLADHCNKMELVLPDGLVETYLTGDIEDFKDCVYVSKKYIDTLNGDIMNLEKLHADKLKELDDKLNSVFDTETLHKELRLKIKIEENNLQDVKRLKFNKYVKDYLAEMRVSLKEPYEAKDVDNVRAEKVKKLVRSYFKRYMDAVKKIKNAKREGKNIAKRNINLDKGIQHLKYQVQTAKEKFDAIGHEEKQKPIQERTEAIMYHAQLLRQVKKNEEELESLWEEYEKLQMKTYPFFRSSN